jgi:rhodanese-related sulfurtransferase
MANQLDRPKRAAAFSFVLETAAADPQAAQRHFAAKLSVETDPADVHADLERGAPGFRLLDVRSAEHYAQCHIVGAESMPARGINAESVRAAGLSTDDVLVVYCWGPGCNGATKAALRLSALGFRVKEMIGGIEYWRREGHPVEGILGDAAPLVG